MHIEQERNLFGLHCKTMVVGAFQCNCRILTCPETGETAVVDPGDQPEKILAAIAGLKTPLGTQVQVKYLFHTHGHLDHVGGTRRVREQLACGSSYGPPLSEMRSGAIPRIALHRADEPLYLKLIQQGQLFGLKYDSPLAVDHFLEEGEQLTVGKLKFSVIHTPGHSPGSVCLRLHEDSSLKTRETLFSGDTLFQGTVGRTDLWGGDQDLMFKSIRQKILTLDGDTQVCPGHGPDTSVGKEKHSNPYL